MPTKRTPTASPTRSHKSYTEKQEAERLAQDLIDLAAQAGDRIKTLADKYSFTPPVSFSLSRLPDDCTSTISSEWFEQHAPMSLPPEHNKSLLDQYTLNAVRDWLYASQACKQYADELNCRKGQMLINGITRMFTGMIMQSLQNGNDMQQASKEALLVVMANCICLGMQMGLPAGNLEKGSSDGQQE